ALATAPAAGAAADRVATSGADAPISESQPAPSSEKKAVTLWVDPAFCEELAAVAALLSHAVPSGKNEDVLMHVLRAQRKLLERRRHGANRVSAARAPSEAHKDERYIPAPMRREVYDREGGTCAYVGAEGRRCNSRRQLEYQHIIPFARGGSTTVENLTLYCR